MISNNVHILSDADYEYEIEKSFQRGVKRGKFESLADVTPARIAGLREAAEILEDEGFLGLSMQRILARIAELEKQI